VAFFHRHGRLFSVKLRGSIIYMSPRAPVPLRKEPRLSKWPFFIADLLLLAAAGWIVWQSAKPLTMWPLLSVVGCAALGAWVCITPFLTQYRADLKFAEADKLTTAVDQISNLRTLMNQLSFATAQWQVMQENAAKGITAAKDISDRVAADAQAFSEFMVKANDTEKAHLRLEIDKLRRSERDWVQLVVHLLDHVYALQQAAVRSGQQSVVNQLTQFQRACRELVRRVGIMPVDVKAGEPYQEKNHQLPDGHPVPESDAVIGQMLAPGYTFQAQLIRNPLVVTKKPEGVLAEDAVRQEQPGPEKAERHEPQLGLGHEIERK
jgi:hypothetical protein